jgi:opacity protein-like surface antigen
MRVRGITVVGALVLSLAAASNALADGFVEPFTGITFGGSADTNRYVYGGRVGAIGRTAGFEAEFAYAPNFFSGSDKFGQVPGKLNITTLMGNLLIGGVPQHRGGVRPYLVGGFGLMRALVSSPNAFFNDITDNDFAFDLGGGLQGYFNEHVGLRGDVRYFRSLTGNSPTDTDPRNFGLGDFSYWRGTVGVTFKF